MNCGAAAGAAEVGDGIGGVVPGSGGGRGAITAADTDTRGGIGGVVGVLAIGAAGGTTTGGVVGGRTKAADAGAPTGATALGAAVGGGEAGREGVVVGRAMGGGAET